jgi:hypothetical protein
VSFDARMLHSLAIVRTARDGTPDEWGQPTPGTPTVVATFRGLIQPNSAREIALISQAGAEVSDHTLFCRPWTSVVATTSDSSPMTAAAMRS